MNKKLAGQESNKPIPESKSVRLSPSLAGALTGILSVLLVSLLYRSIRIDSLAVGFLYPGYLALEKIDSLNINISRLTAFLIYYGLSCVPPAMIGALLFSDKITPRIVGVVLLIIYAILWMGFSFFLHIMAD